MRKYETIQLSPNENIPIKIEGESEFTIKRSGWYWRPIGNNAAPWMGPFDTEQEAKTMAESLLPLMEMFS